MTEFERFITYLTSERRASGHTVKAYANDLRQFECYLAEHYELHSFSLAGTLELRSWFAHLKDSGISSRSIRRKRSGVSTLYRFLRREGLVERDPVSRTRIPRGEKRLPVYVDQGSMERLLEGSEWPEGWEGQRDALMLILLYESGMRLAELISLKTADIDFGKKELRVVGKRNKERIIPLLTETLTAMSEYLKTRHDVFADLPAELLVTDKGVKLYPKFVYRKVNYYLGRVSTLEKRSPHILRHSFATHMLNHGAQLNTVKELLGHASLAATQVYTHNTIEKLKRVHEQSHPKG